MSSKYLAACESFDRLLDNTKWTINDFEIAREDMITHGSTYPVHVRTLGFFEGLMKVTKPMRDFSFHGYEDHRPGVTRMIKRIYKDRVVNIELAEEISDHVPHIYSVKGTMQIFSQENDPRPLGEIALLEFDKKDILLSRLTEKNIDDGILLLSLYKDVVKTPSYLKRQEQTGQVRKILKEERGMIV